MSEIKEQPPRAKEQRDPAQAHDPAQVDSAPILNAARPVVIVMAKAPRAGQAKTRLAPPLRLDESAALAACFAQDTVALARGLAPHVMLAYAPTDARALLEPLMPEGLLWTEQRGDDLGARISAAIAAAAAGGGAPFLVLGTDSPTLPPAYARAALRALTVGETDIALGPTDDGGYYLIGLRRPPPAELFRAIVWSSAQVYQQTAANAARLGLRLRELPRWYDVDTATDLCRLQEELVTDGEARMRAQQTYGWLVARQMLSR